MTLGCPDCEVKVTFLCGNNVDDDIDNGDDGFCTFDNRDEEYTLGNSDTEKVVSI
jgi:hypothetical protein